MTNPGPSSDGRQDLVSLQTLSTQEGQASYPRRWAAPLSHFLATIPCARSTCLGEETQADTWHRSGHMGPTLPVRLQILGLSYTCQMTPLAQCWW